MIKSMTGYGSAKGTVEGIEVCVELKSVNNKFLDTSVRLPRSFLFAEELVKSAVQKHISRGKVDVFVTVDSSMADDMVVRVNEPLLKGYIDALNHIAEEFNIPNELNALSVSRFPDVLSVEKKELDAEPLIRKLSKRFEGTLNDVETAKELGISRQTVEKYIARMQEKDHTNDQGRQLRSWLRNGLHKERSSPFSAEKWTAEPHGHCP